MLPATAMPTTRRQIRAGYRLVTDEKDVSFMVGFRAETRDGRLLGLSALYRAVATGLKTEAGLEVAKAGQQYVSLTSL